MVGFLFSLVLVAGSPWADSADDPAVYMLESALGSYSSDILQGWDLPQSVDSPSPDVWTDGSLVRDEVSGSAWADFGRRRVWPDVADARWNLSGVCRLWYPTVLLLHRFFIAISRAVVNCDDSSSLALILLFGLLGAFLRGAASLTLFEMLL